MTAAAEMAPPAEMEPLTTNLSSALMLSGDRQPLPGARRRLVEGGLRTAPMRSGIGPMKRLPLLIVLIVGAGV
jgi:hypothetical protein